MKLVAASRILNESDIVEAFVRHTAHYVDHHIFLDNGSTDGTLAILTALHAEGFGITVFQAETVYYHEMASGTFLYERAMATHAADWVIFLDTDEFIDDRGLNGSLRNFLGSFSRDRPEILALQVRVREYVVTPSDPDLTLITSRITHCREITNNTKVIIKGGLVGPGMHVMPGNHGLRVEPDRDYAAYFQDEISYAHFASRSSYQWISKFVIGWAKVKAAGPSAAGSGLSHHYRGPFEKLVTAPEAILRSVSLMTLQTNVAALIDQPLVYRGGALKHTPPVDYAMKCVMVIMAYLDNLATQHGEMQEWMHRRTNLLPRASLAPAEILSPPSTAAIRGYRPSRDEAMTSAFLTSRTWKFFHQQGPLQGSIGALHLRFCPDGTIAGYAHQNEAGWQLQGETLCLLDTAGEPSTRFNYVDHESPEVIFTGQHIGDPAIILCLLEQNADAVADADTETTQEPDPWWDGSPDVCLETAPPTETRDVVALPSARAKPRLWHRLRRG